MANHFIGSIILSGMVVLIVLIMLGYFLHWFYRHARKDLAFVRTGFGGEKVVINSGAFVLPIIHEITPVHLNVIRISVLLNKEQAVITKDRVRVDIEAEFFVRVRQDHESVARAAASLGHKMMIDDALAELLSGKFKSALRTTIATSTLDEIHETRDLYIEKVHEQINKALACNGLELETLAILELDQTDLNYFRPTNRFDAEGLTQLIEVIETRRKLRNDIEQSSMISIRQRNLDVERKILQIDKDSEIAKLDQERELAEQRTEQQAEIKRRRVTREAEAEKTRIKSEQETKRQEILAHEELEQARIASEQGLAESEIIKTQNLQRVEIEQEKINHLVTIERHMALLKKQAEEAKVQTQTETSKLELTVAQEELITKRETMTNERQVQIDRLLATKDADLARIASEAEVFSGKVIAENNRLANEAENILSDTARHDRLRANLIDHLEGILRESARALEKVDSIKILHMDGLGNNSQNSSASRSPTDEVIESVLRYRAQAPLIDEMMKELGVENAGITRMGDIFRSARDVQALQQDVEKGHKRNNQGDQ